MALTYDGASLRLYVNGTQVATRAAAGAIQASANPLWIGGNQPYGEYFRGLIDEARVYNRALTRDRDPKRHGRPARLVGAGEPTHVIRMLMLLLPPTLARAYSLAPVRSTG